METWNEISNENDLKDFMKMVWSFHDSCIKEFKYISGAYADDTAMYPINDKRILSIIFQGICGESIDFSVIEMQFTGLIELRVFPNDEKYTCEIFGASMFIREGRFFWCDSDDVVGDDLNDYKGTVICSSKVRWRPADEYTGQEEVYKAT